MPAKEVSISVNTQLTQHSPAQIQPIQLAAQHGRSRHQSLKSHSLAFSTDPEHGIRVPVTEIALEPSPGGVRNPPFRVVPHGRPGQRSGPRPGAVPDPMD